MIPTLLLISSLIGAAGSYPYIIAVARGRVQPRIVSWGVWVVLAAITTYSALMEGQVASAILSLQALICCGIIVIFGWRRGSVRLGWLDIACLIGAALGIVSLIWLQNPVIALFVAIAVDAVAFVPTLLHAWTAPDEESITCFACAVIAGLLVVVVAARTDATIVGLAYPIYSVVFNGIMTLLLIASRLTPDSRYAYTTDET